MLNQMHKIQFIDLKAQQKIIGKKIHRAIAQVLKHGQFILGEEVEKLEAALSQYTGATEVITCANGTDALTLLLMAYGVGPNDAVFVPTFTFASTAEAVAQLHATPVFVDVCPITYNIDLNSLNQAIQLVSNSQLTPKGIIAVDLFGLPADYPALLKIAACHDLWVIADAAQSFGGAIKTQKVGTLAQATTTSFFPSKPLGCYGDGGAIFTNNLALANTIRSLRNHGAGTHRYDHIHIGLNSRLDTLQAAILIEKLAIFPFELERRKEIASIYNDALQNLVQIPKQGSKIEHAWGLYTIACQNNAQRTLFAKELQLLSIPTNIYYRKPLHLQPIYQQYPRASKHLPQAEALCQKVLSLPMHPYLTESALTHIISTIKKLSYMFEPI